MAEKEPHAVKSLPPNLMPGEIAETGIKRFEQFVKAQSEFFGGLQEANRQRCDRALSEANITNIASDFALKVAAARSVPDAIKLVQEWNRRWFDMMAEDCTELFGAAQNFVEASSSSLINGSRNVST